MKKIELINMKVRNFKGFKEFELAANGKNVQVFGDNATGKTTLYDAFLWCLFGKDSKDSTKFSWKPLDQNNQEIHHLETEVVLELLIDGEEIEFSRMNKEKWTKKRGSNAETFEGHDATYRIDGLKQTQIKFKKRIEEIVNEETFKQITNIYYIAETMPAKERRKMLFSLVEDLTDIQVIESNKELTPLLDILGKHSVEDKRQMIAEERRNINKDLDNIPQRIDEVDRSINPDLTEANRLSLEDEKTSRETELAKNEQELASKTNGTYLTNKRSELTTKVAELEADKSNYTIKQNEKIAGLQSGKQIVYEQAMSAQNEVLEEEKRISNLKTDIESEKSYISRLQQEKESLRNKYISIRDNNFPDFDAHKTTCQFCNQDLPVEQQATIKETYQKEREAFNLNRASELEQINEQGTSLSKEEEVHEELLQDLKNQVADTTELDKRIKVRDDLKSQHTAIIKQIEAIQNNATPFTETEQYKKKIAEIEAIKQEIITIQTGDDKELQSQKEVISNIKLSINQLNEQLYEYVLSEKQEARKQELIEEEKLLSVKFGELDQQLYLLDEFIRTKVDLLTSKINAKFNYVDFKLFEEQINGGLKEVCEVTVKGVPYSSGLNNAARINAGLDIINTVTEINQINAPIFIDNAESINELLAVQAQTITLSVSQDKNLKMEVVK
ncbi:AAA family ATPase [Carnobacterium maltaromaticum]|uniref:AAA family ATPase n=1 Tax=Carnobacterium maltaromaticum TaxID=2751 RepID=UPI0010749B1F|nr:AAA family ATPase [Carnobacterium maltaromaticum]MDT1944361.1 AAA family ATPase [Carnobacterium maltaromaticum]MDT1997917.1 AAA family ATPase [Carnobacterium maltaromaticum]TFJ56900.1 hypothetical protein CKN96_10650 [Carnobacterium maltaromaticum]